MKDLFEDGKLYSNPYTPQIPPTIFVVDDESDTREILSAVFESFGYLVDTFETGEILLDVLDDDTVVDLIILDLMMPGIDGLETCSSIRKMFTSQQLPIIVASALDDNLKRIKALELGADDFIIKPFEPREVVKRAEIQLEIRKTLKESEVRRHSLETLFETIPVGVVQLGIGDVLPIVNSAAREILSLDEAPTAGRVCETLGFDPLRRIQGEDGPVAEDRRYASGNYRVDCRAVENDGELLGGLIVLRNVTRESALDDLKAEFAQVISHELRTPLTAINNAVTVLDGPDPLDEKSKEKLFGIVKRNTDRMTGMISELLDLSKMEAGRIELTLVEGNLMRISGRVADALQHLAQTREVSIRRTFSESFPEYFFMDVSAVERVITNLLSNAIKYTNEGTEVTIEGVIKEHNEDAQKDPRAALLHTFAKGYAEMRISDRGLGVPADEQERIFEKFVRIPRKVYKDTSGSGLGLPIAQSLVHAHGGNLWVESTPGLGASFIFRLPIFDRYGALAVSIADRLCAAKRDRRSIGLIVLRLFCDKKTDEQSEFTWDSAGDLAEVAKGALLRSTDHAVFNPHLGEVVVILEGCMREILPQVGMRVSSEIRRHFRECCPELKTSVSVGYAYSSPSADLETAVAALSEARAAASEDRESRRRVLIVDDDELFAMSTARLLSRYHFDAVFVSKADEALEFISRQIPDLVILDIMMPGLDGYRLGLEMKSRSELKHIPMIFISALDGNEISARVFASGGNSFLRKPVEASELINTLNWYLG